MKYVYLFLIAVSMPIGGWCGASLNNTSLFGDIDMGNNDNVTTGSLTVGGWIKMTEDTNADSVIGKKSNLASSASGYFIYADASDNLHGIVSDGVTQKTCDSTNDFDGEWTYVVMTFNGTNDNTILYENGVASCSPSVGTVGSITSSATFKMGNITSGSPGDNFVGSMAYGFFYSIVLTAPQRAELRVKPDSYGAARSYWYLTGNSSTQNDYGSTNFPATTTAYSEDTDGPPVMFGQGLPL